MPPHVSQLRCGHRRVTFRVVNNAGGATLESARAQIVNRAPVPTTTARPLPTRRSGQPNSDTVVDSVAQGPPSTCATSSAATPPGCRVGPPSRSTRVKVRAAPAPPDRRLDLPGAAGINATITYHELRCGHRLGDVPGREQRWRAPWRACERRSSTAAPAPTTTARALPTRRSGIAQPRTRWWIVWPQGPPSTCATSSAATHRGAVSGTITLYSGEGSTGASSPDRRL